MPRRILTVGALWLGLHGSEPGPPVTVDRIEGDIAVIEWTAGALGDVPLVLLPPGTREGDQLRLQWRPVSPDRPDVQLPGDRNLPTADRLVPTRVQLRAPQPRLLATRRKDDQT